MTNTDTILIICCIAFILWFFTSIVGICFAFGSQPQATEKNYKLSMLIGVYKYQTITLGTLILCFVFMNCFSAFNTNSFKKEIIKYQQSITPENLNKYVLKYENTAQG